MNTVKKNKAKRRTGQPSFAPESPPSRFVRRPEAGHALRHGTQIRYQRPPTLRLEAASGMVERRKKKMFRKILHKFRGHRQILQRPGGRGAEGLSDCVNDHLRIDTYDAGLDGLCDCGDCSCSDRIGRLFDGKVTLCRLEPVPQSQKDYHRFRDILSSWTKQLHELDKDKYKCFCPVSSTEWVIDDKNWTVHPLNPSSSSSSSASSSGSSTEWVIHNSNWIELRLNSTSSSSSR